MKIIKTAKKFLDWKSKIHSSVGFVPTMGALHSGHLSLIKTSKINCEITVVSIFVNPTQFSKEEDFDTYPNHLENDIKFLNEMMIDVLFLPNKKEMYSNVNKVDVPTSELYKKLEGQSRPHFFKGVTQIVAKLFNVIQPTHTFFGEKDAQQLIIINEMISTMNYKIKLVSCPTVRDENGLALSSRNQYLTIEEQKEASQFSLALIQMKHAIDSGELNSIILKNQFNNKIKQLSKIKLDYISIANKLTLDEVDVIKGEVLISSAVFYNDVRLIDNFSYQSST